MSHFPRSIPVNPRARISRSSQSRVILNTLRHMATMIEHQRRMLAILTTLKERVINLESRVGDSHGS